MRIEIKESKVANILQTDLGIMQVQFRQTRYVKGKHKKALIKQQLIAVRIST